MHTAFQVYYDSDTLSTNSNMLDISKNPILIAGKLIALTPNFQIGGNAGTFRAIIEKKLTDYDTNTSLGMAVIAMISIKVQILLI